MDKSWITKPQNSIGYEQGVRGFINFAFEHQSVNGKTICPCKRCGFKKWQCREILYDHLMCTPFPVTYTTWIYHGESKVRKVRDISVKDIVVVENPLQNMINDAFRVDTHHTNKAPIVSNVEID